MNRISVRVFSSVVVAVFVLILLSPDATGSTTDADNFMDMDIEELLNVEISVASKKPESLIEAPGVVVVIPRDEIEVYGDRNLHQLLQRQPSIYTRDVFPYTDNVAGFRGDLSMVTDSHTLILLNGRPVRESGQGLNVNTYLTFPLSMLEGAELIRGPGSVLYGTNAFTGVVNLKSRPAPAQPEFSVSGMGGSHGYYETNLTAAGKAGALGYVTALRLAGQQGYPYRMTDALGVYGEDDRKYDSYSGAVHLNYQKFTFDGFWSDYNAFSLGVVPFWSNPNRSFRNKKLFLNAGYRIPMHDRVTLELNATYNLQENGLSSFKPEIIGNNTSDLLGEVTLFANPIDNANVIAGYLQEYRTNYTPSDDKYQSIPPYHYAPRSTYAQGDYRIGHAVKVIAGTQWNESSQGFRDFVSRYGVIVTPRKKWGVKLLRGEAFKAPVAVETDLYDPGILMGNKDLEPEQATTYDVQLFYNDEKTYAAVTYFHSIIDKLIIYDASAVPDMSYMNGGKHQFEGVELEVKHFFTPRWHILGSVMYQDNQADIGLNPSVVPEKMAKVGTAYAWDEGSVSIFCCFYGNPPDIYFPTLSPPFVSTLIANPEPKATHLVNMNVDLDVSRWMGLDKGRSTFTFRIENLLNEKVYVPTLAYSGTPNSFPYGPGITFYAGLKVDL